MKTYTVTLRNKLGVTVLTHNLSATNRTDAELKANVLLENVRDNSVVSVTVN